MRNPSIRNPQSAIRNRKIRSLPLAVLTRRHLTSPPRPNEVCRQAGEHDTETDYAVQRILVHQAESYHTTCGDKEKRCERMARHAESVTIAIMLSKNKDRSEERRVGKSRKPG